MKRRFDVLYPTLFGVLAVALMFSKPDLAEPMLRACRELLQLLVGFYVATLGVVVALNRPEFDVKLDGGAWFLRRSDGSDEILTRRRLLSLALGYLAYASLVLYLYGSLLLAFDLNGPSWEVFRVVLWFGFLFPFGTVLTTTVFAINYLSERLFRT